MYRVDGDKRVKYFINDLSDFQRIFDLNNNRSQTVRTVREGDNEYNEIKSSQPNNTYELYSLATNPETYNQPMTKFVPRVSPEELNGSLNEDGSFQSNPDNGAYFRTKAEQNKALWDLEHEKANLLDKDGEFSFRRRW